MVGSLVRFLFTRCEESKTHQPWSNLYKLHCNYSAKQRQFLCRISIEEMWYGLLINCLLHGTYCLELFQFDWFLSNYNLKIFHKLKFMTIFFSSNFPSPRKITTEQVNRKFIIYQLIVRTWWIRWINRKCFMWRSKNTLRQ